VTKETSERAWIRSWPRDVPRSIQYPKFSLTRFLTDAASMHPEKTALLYTKDRITFHQLHSLAQKFGKALQDRGVRKGDRVAIYLPNVPDFIVSYYGALSLGAIVVAISPIYKENEILQILTDSKAKVLVSLDKLKSQVDNVRDQTGLELVINCSLNESLTEIAPTSREEAVADKVSMKTLLSNTVGFAGQVVIESEKDLALLQYTGGTTGAPKGAMLTHHNLVANAIQFANWLGLKTAAETHLAALPFFHIYGMTVALNVPIYTASGIVLIPDARDTDAILHAIDRYNPSIFCGVPAMYVALINRPDIREHRLNSIRVCVSGASPLPIQVQKRFEELTGGRLVEGYGLTEASPVTHVNPIDEPGKNRSGSIGVPISDTDARIVDVETGSTDLPPGKVGELVVRGPQIMLGYWNDPTESRLVLRNGWLYTGDIATMDSDGYFRIVDRKKDIINVSGFKVWPREVEDVLYEHPAVKNCAAVTAPDATSGEVVKVFVTLQDQYKGHVTADDIITFCKTKLADYKAPRIVDFRDTLPTSSVGKILRRKLREPSQE